MCSVHRWQQLTQSMCSVHRWQQLTQSMCSVHRWQQLTQSMCSVHRWQQLTQSMCSVHRWQQLTQSMCSVHRWQQLTQSMCSVHRWQQLTQSVCSVEWKMDKGSPLVQTRAESSVSPVQKVQRNIFTSVHHPADVYRTGHEQHSSNHAGTIRHITHTTEKPGAGNLNSPTPTKNCKRTCTDQ